MQYLLLIRQGETPLPGSEAWDAMKQVYPYCAVNELPGVTPGLSLGLPEHATTVRVQDGKLMATDGPFAETKDAGGGWFVLEAANLEAAL